MIVVTHQREKCIGCNYCVEIHPERWRMSKKDGKVTLIGALNKKGFHTAKLGESEFDLNQRSAEVCPVKIIKVKKV